MHDRPNSERASDAAELGLRDELARLDRAVAAAPHILRYAITSDGRELVSDVIVARVRGMLGDLARQLLESRVEPGAGHIDEDAIQAITAELAADERVLGHCHAVASEGHLLERLSARGIDPVVPPLIAELAGSEDGQIAALAMHVLAAQARFVQHQHRMAAPVTELPAEAFQSVLERVGGLDNAKLRTDYDEGGGRLALLARLSLAIAGDARASNLDQAGLSLFASVLASRSGMSRDAVVLSLAAGSTARLALTLRSAGEPADAIAALLARIDPDASIPHGLDAIEPAQAAAMLAGFPRDMVS